MKKFQLTRRIDNKPHCPTITSTGVLNSLCIIQRYIRYYFSGISSGTSHTTMASCLLSGRTASRVIGPGKRSA